MTTLPVGTAIPAALVQLMAIAAAALPPDSTVWYGEELGTFTQPLTLQVNEIPGDQVPAEIGQRYRREETFAFVCTLTYFDGGPGEENPRRLSTLMDAWVKLALAVGANPKLNDTVRFAEVGNFNITTTADANGLTAANIDFSVRCQQRVESLPS
jgi:hypothetical protein